MFVIMINDAGLRLDLEVTNDDYDRKHGIKNQRMYFEKADKIVTCPSNEHFQFGPWTSLDNY
jgi:hypothetical protein